MQILDPTQKTGSILSFGVLYSTVLKIRQKFFISKNAESI